MGVCIARLNLHPSSSLHHAGLSPIVLPAVDGECKETVKLATQTDSEIQTMSTAQHQLSQHLHPHNVQHHIPEFVVKIPGTAVPVMSRTIALKEKLKVWNIVFVWSSLQCLLGGHSHEETYMRNVVDSTAMHIPKNSQAAYCVGVSSHPVLRDLFYTHLAREEVQRQVLWLWVQGVAASLKPMETWPRLDTAVT